MIFSNVGQIHSPLLQLEISAASGGCFRGGRITLPTACFSCVISICGTEYRLVWIWEPALPLRRVRIPV